jgi:hypothetical protein
VWELKTFKTLVGKAKKIKLDPQDTIKNVLKRQCFKRLCIVHLDLICMNYDKKKGQKSNLEFDFQPQIL